MKFDAAFFRVFTFAKRVIGKNPLLYRRSRLTMRNRRVEKFPDWRNILGADYPTWEKILAKAQSGIPVLIAAGNGGNLPGTTLETMLATALTLRGAKVHALLCDSALPACWECDSTLYPNLRRFTDKGPLADLCGTCFKPGAQSYRSLGIPVLSLGAFLSKEDREEAGKLSRSLNISKIQNYRHDGMAVGEHALAGALRFFARGDLDNEPGGEPVLRRYFEAALLTARATEKALRQGSYAAVVCTHGIYVPHGLIGEAARKAGIRLVNWNVAYRKRCFIFSHGDTYHHTLMNEPVETWENMAWTTEMEKKILAYLKARTEGTKEDWVWFHDKPVFDMGAIGKDLGLDPTKPCIGLLTNVIWDAQLHYPANAFPSLTDWALRTIDYFAKRPELQLIIRIHPAEIRGFLKSRQLMAEEIRKRFPALPKNVFVIPPESQYSTYALMGACDSVLIYGTKTGVELASMGIPVIVAGEAWIRNKGVTRDAASAEDYFRILDSLPVGRRMDPAMLQRARKYAYHFFFRRMVPLGMLETQESLSLPYQVKIKGLDDLGPGKDPGLDLLCSGILEGADFIYRDEETLKKGALP